MKPVGLALGDLPPLRVPLRFYLTAPWFGVATGLVWIAQGDAAFLSRWTPGTLAATHLLTLGFLAMVMIGSLFQVVPVLGGGAIPAAVAIAPIVHGGLALGAACLALGLALGSKAWLALALVGLGVGFGVFVPLLGWRLAQRVRGDAIFTIRLAALALVVTLALGVWMAGGIAWPWFEIAYRSWTDTHARFGLGGWVMLLIFGVSYQVVPMFHVTPAFDTRFVKVVGLLVFGGLALCGTWPTVGVTAIASAGLAYVVVAARALHRRRRRRAEPAVRAWQVAHGFLALSLALGWKLVAWPALAIPGVPPHVEPVLLAVLFGFGFALTVVFGMLAKIVPFLAFTHLQRACLRNLAAVPLLPTMDAIWRDTAAWTQLVLHTVTTLVVAAAVLEPGLGVAAGIATVTDFGWCARNVSVAAHRYASAARAIAVERG